MTFGLVCGCGCGCAFVSGAGFVAVEAPPSMSISNNCEISVSVSSLASLASLASASASICSISSSFSEISLGGITFFSYSFIKLRPVCFGDSNSASWMALAGLEGRSGEWESARLQEGLASKAGDWVSIFLEEKEVENEGRLEEDRVLVSGWAGTDFSFSSSSSSLNLRKSSIFAVSITLLFVGLCSCDADLVLLKKALSIRPFPAPNFSFASFSPFLRYFLLNSPS